MSLESFTQIALFEVFCSLLSGKIRIKNKNKKIKKILLTNDLIVASDYETCSGSNTDLVAVFKTELKCVFQTNILHSFIK